MNRDDENWQYKAAVEEKEKEEKMASEQSNNSEKRIM